MFLYKDYQFNKKKKGDREILKKRIYVDVVILLNRN